MIALQAAFSPNFPEGRSLYPLPLDLEALLALQARVE